MTTIGEMRHTVTIESRAGASDGMGGQTWTWSTFLSGFAHVRPKSAREAMFTQKLEQNITHIVTMRYRAGITADMRVNYTIGASTRYLQIQGVINVEERNRFVQLLCMEGTGS